MILCLYINQDAYCSSLLELNTEIITKDANKKNNLWYCPSEISKIISQHYYEISDKEAESSWKKVIHYLTDMKQDAEFIK